jgi:hypothetical protein
MKAKKLPHSEVTTLFCGAAVSQVRKSGAGATGKIIFLVADKYAMIRASQISEIGDCQ